MENRKNIFSFSIKNRKNRKIKISAKNMHNSTEQSPNLNELRRTIAPKSKVSEKPHSNEAGIQFVFLQHNFSIKLAHILR